MKKFKKVFAVILSLAMVLGMSLTSFAADKPAATDNTKAVVNNVEATATVTAYRIVEPEYNNYGLTGYKRAANITETMLADPLNPTSNEITSIANQISKGDLTLKDSQGFTAGVAGQNGLAQFTADLTPGYWVVIVTGSGIQEVYNPMLVGVYYNKSGSDNTLTAGPVDADTNWSLDSTPAYAKSSQPTLDKKITGQSGKTPSDGNENGDDVAIGDTVNYEIDTVIPSYSNSYAATNVRVEISDKLSDGLDLTADSIKVYVGGSSIKDSTLVTPATDTYSVVTNARDFTISFNSAYALANNGQNVFVTYDAVLNANAGTNFDPNTNTAKLTYTNDPSDRNHVDEIEDETYTYTFEIDGSLFGKSSETWNKVTEELLKGVKKKETTETDKRENFNPLGGATFTLTNNATGKVYTTTSDDDGMLNFKGLDAGTYTLQETVAPDGYSINNAQIPVVISAEYESNGKLKNYTITVNGENTSTYKAIYDKGNIDHIEYEFSGEDPDEDPDEDISDSYYFWNTTLASLPSTGGIGTTIFTIGGCAIMIIAAALFFASRRKNAK